MVRIRSRMGRRSCTCVGVCVMMMIITLCAIGATLTTVWSGGHIPHHGKEWGEDLFTKTTCYVAGAEVTQVNYCGGSGVSGKPVTTLYLAGEEGGVGAISAQPAQPAASYRDALTPLASTRHRDKCNGICNSNFYGRYALVVNLPPGNTSLSTAVQAGTCGVSQALGNASYTGAVGCELTELPCAEARGPGCTSSACLLALQSYDQCATLAPLRNCNGYWALGSHDGILARLGGTLPCWASTANPNWVTLTDPAVLDEPFLWKIWISSVVIGLVFVLCTYCVACSGCAKCRKAEHGTASGEEGAHPFSPDARVDASLLGTERQGGTGGGYTPLVATQPTPTFPPNMPAQPSAPAPSYGAYGGVVATAPPPTHAGVAGGGYAPPPPQYTPHSTQAYPVYAPPPVGGLGAGNVQAPPTAYPPPAYGGQPQWPPVSEGSGGGGGEGGAYPPSYTYGK